jgi:hypothetical protein
MIPTGPYGGTILAQYWHKQHHFPLFHHQISDLAVTLLWAKTSQFCGKNH